MPLSAASRTNRLSRSLILVIVIQAQHKIVDLDLYLPAFNHKRVPTRAHRSEAKKALRITGLLIAASSTTQGDMPVDQPCVGAQDSPGDPPILTARRRHRQLHDQIFRYRHGERIATGFVESTVNQVVSKRMVRRQQMRWTKKGAHLLLQVRTQVLNEDLRTTFGHWYTGMASTDVSDQLAA
jgi:hypothetical protein